MPGILVEDSSFASAISSQKTALSKLRAIHDSQQACLNNLADTWKGDSGAWFRNAIAEVSKETLSGIFMVTAITNQTASSQNMFKETDQKVAQSVFSQTAK